MHPHPAAASTLIPIILLVTIGYIAVCAWWPFHACRTCSGTGRHHSPSGRAFRYCRHCKGTGARLRLGRLIWNFIRDLHKECTR